MESKIEHIQNEIQSLREEIIHHKVYEEIKTLEDLQIFMQYHVYAVWDFMSILKALQRNLTCVELPWFPVGDAETRHLINEIVTGEESDLDAGGIHKSHFELYIDAMNQCGADTTSINTFVIELKSSGNFEEAYQKAATPLAPQNFVNFTFDIINSGKTHNQAAVFTFGREDLIPNMFVTMVNDIHKTFPESVSIYKYYLERHIEVDGDHHSHLALQMTSNLCENDDNKWEEALKVTLASLEQRKALWDGAYEAIIKTR